LQSASSVPHTAPAAELSVRQRFGAVIFRSPRQ
jgi:hypothetical protein